MRECSQCSGTAPLHCCWPVLANTAAVVTLAGVASTPDSLLPLTSTPMVMPADYLALNQGYAPDWGVSFDNILRSVGKLLSWGTSIVPLAALDVGQDYFNPWARLVIAGRSGLGRAVVLATTEFIT